jgi:hypothetical protein
MQIFLSFASEQKAQAEPIALALRARGYLVFFSHDDLPPGDSFDARVEQAVAACDLMVFLISPESTTKGRYTLTELAFARAKWPNPSNHVLPVLIAPTPLERLPSYLKAVTILEPEGNAAAEVSAAVTRILRAAALEEKAPQTRTILIFSALAIPCAVLCYLAVTFAPNFLAFSFVEKAPDKPMTIVPGLLFGILVAACDYVFAVRDRFFLLAVVLLTTVGWIVAVDSAVGTVKVLSEYQKSVNLSAQDPPADDSQAGADNDVSAPAPPLFQREFPGSFYVAGIVGGAVGGTFTILGLLITNIGFRRLESCVLAWATATAAGAVLGVANLMGSWAFLTLFSVWQCAVITAIARGLAGPTQNFNSALTALRR